MQLLKTPLAERTADVVKRLLMSARICKNTYVAHRMHARVGAGDTASRAQDQFSEDVAHERTHEQVLMMSPI